MIITLTLLSVFSALLTFLILFRTGRIIQDQNEQSDAFIQALNFQTNKINELRDIVESALDCLLIADSKSAAPTDN